MDKLMARVDIDQVLDRVDMEKLMAPVDINEIAGRIDIEALVANTDLGALMASSSSTLATEAVDRGRSHAVSMDDTIARWVSRLRATTPDELTRPNCQTPRRSHDRVWRCRPDGTCASRREPITWAVRCPAEPAGRARRGSLAVRRVRVRLGRGDRGGSSCLGR